MLFTPSRPGAQAPKPKIVSKSRRVSAQAASISDHKHPPGKQERTIKVGVSAQGAEQPAAPNKDHHLPDNSVSQHLVSQNKTLLQDSILEQISSQGHDIQILPTSHYHHVNEETKENDPDDGDDEFIHGYGPPTPRSVCDIADGLNAYPTVNKMYVED